jgi:hypothetical protein
MTGLRFPVLAACACMGSAAFSQTLDDLTVTWATDGACYVMTISNHLAPANVEAAYTLSDPVSVQLTVLHEWPEGPETVFASVPVGWNVWPEQIEIADHDKGAMTICPEVGV